jgi:hypothetical protein
MSGRGPRRPGPRGQGRRNRQRSSRRKHGRQPRVGGDLSRVGRSCQRLSEKGSSAILMKRASRPQGFADESDELFR